jgi:MFS family permease
MFGITSIPFGVAAGFAQITMPFLLRKAGLSVESIGWYGTAVLVPSFVQFLYAPMIDIGPKRRSWLVLVSVLGAACMCAALTMPLPGKASTFLALTFVGQVLCGLVGSCNGGLLATTVPDAERGKAGGWYNAGNLGGGALGAGLTLWLAQRASTGVVAAALAASIVVPSLAALALPEADRVKRAAREIFGTMLRDVWRTARSRAGWMGMLFCLSPVGTAALNNYFSALAEDYHASANMVAFVNGALCGLLTAAGSLIGGYLCDRMDRRVAYLASGALTAVVAFCMMAAPITPTAYTVGVIAYFIVTGFCYAAFSAVVLEAVGKAGASASAQYTLFTSAGNFAITYVGWIDTRFHTQHGPRGLLAADGALNIAGVVALGIMIALVFRKKDVAADAAEVEQAAA